MSKDQQYWLPAVITICLMLLPLHLAKAPLAPLYSTDFENVTKKDAHRLNMGIDNWFGFEGDGGATMWMEGLDRHTAGITCHSGSRCVGMELTNITKSRRNEFNIMNLTDLVGNELFVSVWLHLPPDWQLHLSGEWYEIINPFFTGPPTYLPYSSIHILENTTSEVFDLGVDYTDNNVQRTLDYYSNFSLPRGRWFQVQYYVQRNSTDGILRVWIDGKLLANITGLQTKGPSADWFTTPAKIYYDTNDKASSYRIWVDDLEIYNQQVNMITSVLLNARLDVSTNPATVLISGSIYPAPGFPVNVTLEFSDNEGGSYQEVTQFESAVDGTFSYSWKPPRNEVFMIRAEAQGVRSSAVSIGISGVPGFSLESLLIGSALGLLFVIRRRRQRMGRRVLPSCGTSVLPPCGPAIRLPHVRHW
jgi:hypothetical protein